MPDIIRIPSRRGKRTNHHQMPDGPATVPFKAIEEPGWRDSVYIPQSECVLAARSCLGLLIRTNAYTSELRVTYCDGEQDSRYTPKKGGVM